MEQEFFDFLRSSNNLQTFNYGNNSKIMVSKVSYNDKVDIIYSLRSYSGELFNLNSPFKYSGIYDKENNKLFDLEYNIICDILNWDYGDERLIDSSQLYELISDDVNDKIRNLVNDSKDEMFDLKDAELGEEITDNDVIKDFIGGYTHLTFEDNYIEYSTEKPKDILDYLTNKKDFIEEQAREFILDHQSEILKGLTISREKRKTLKKIEDDKNHPYHKIKAIRDTIKDKNYVTINLTINKDEIEQTFKYNAASLVSSYNSKLSYYNIEKVSDRDKFEENFGKWSDFEYRDITKITYGKNTIYEDTNFKNMNLQEEDVLTR